MAKEADHDEMHLGDDNPLVYFLAPAPPLLSTDENGDSYFVDDSDASSYYYDHDHDLDDEDEDEDGGGGGAFYTSSAMDFELDAGIEDAAHPQHVVRSVSPSSLADSLGARTLRAAVRPPTPPRTRGRGGGGGSGGLQIPSAPGVAAPTPASVSGRDGSASSSPLSLSPLSSSLSSSPASPPPGPDLHALDTHPNHLPHHHANTPPTTSHLTAAGAMIVRRRSPRAWRVPSPDVFSIEEETEEELSTGVAAARPGRHAPRTLQVEAAKPPKRKQVRFVLPGEEVA